MRSMRIRANDIDFHYMVDGPEGAPWVVFSNSLATTVAMWDEQAAALKGKYRVLRYDQRGHGKTEAMAGVYTFDLLMADAIALMDGLHIEHANFCGLSMGGATALGLAQRHPETFRRTLSTLNPAALHHQGEERPGSARSDPSEGTDAAS